MTIFTVLSVMFAAVFMGLHGMVLAGLFLEYRRDKKSAAESDRNVDNLPLVSVIIPIHNEKERIGGLLESLSAQDYPLIEVVFVDDRSTDGAGELIREFANRFTSARHTVRQVRLDENPGQNHKQYALSKGIDASAGELLLFTDADCRFGTQWVSAMARRMLSGAMGVLIGPVLKEWRDTTFLTVYQCFEHAVRYYYLVGSTGIGAAGGGFGNNMILRRSVLDIVGGYDAVAESPTEDAALVSAVRRAGFTVRAGCLPDIFVFTATESSWKALVNQTLRWNNGGLFSTDMRTRFNFGLLMVMISIGMICIPLAPFLPFLWTFSAAVLFAMALNTAAVLALFYKKDAFVRPSMPPIGLGYLPHWFFTPAFMTALTILGFAGIHPTWGRD